MSVHPDGKTPVVEPNAGGDVPDITRQSPDQRIRQQEILSELGVIALQGGTMDTLLTKTVHLVAEGLPSEFCKVLEFVLADNCFTVRVGVGWGPGVVGVAPPEFHIDVRGWGYSPPRQGLPSKLASRSSQTILATNSGFARRSCLLVTVFRGQ